MKVGTKFALAFVAAGLASMLVYSSVAASRKVDRIEMTVAEDLTSLGATLGTSVAAIRQRDGDDRARELVAVHERSETISVRWTWLDVGAADPSAPRAGGSVLVPLLRGEQRTWVSLAPRHGRHVYAYVPLLTPGARPAALELSRPLVREGTVFWEEIREQLVMSAFVVALATALALGLTSWIVSRPLARVAARARRIGQGDLSREPPARGSGEVGQLVEELNAMCDSLEEARTRAAEEARQRLAALEQLRHADRLRTVGKLASGVAHELGTPLNVIIMRAKMIGTGEVPPDEAPESAKIIVAQAERVTRIVRQLLDFARRRAPNRADTDLGALVDRTTQLLAGLAKKSRVALAMSPSPEIRANVDPTQIEQAVTNLVMNAIQAMPEGGDVAITVRPEVAGPDGAPDGAQACAVIEVTDTGVGIAPEDLDRIFEPFFTTKGIGEGTGLGLSVTHGIVEDHGGWMRASSTLGGGTRISLFVPLDAL